MPMSYGYVRESGEKQAVSGLGEEAQLPHKAERVAMEEVKRGLVYYDVPEPKAPAGEPE